MIKIAPDASYEEIYALALEYFNNYQTKLPVSQYSIPHSDSRQQVMAVIRDLRKNNVSYLTALFKETPVSRIQISDGITDFEDFLYQTAAACSFFYLRRTLYYLF